jgi:hypothetical protein
VKWDVHRLRKCSTRRELTQRFHHCGAQGPGRGGTTGQASHVRSPADAVRSSMDARRDPPRRRASETSRTMICPMRIFETLS